MRDKAAAGQGAHSAAARPRSAGDHSPRPGPRPPVRPGPPHVVEVVSDALYGPQVEGAAAVDGAVGAAGGVVGGDVQAAQDVLGSVEGVGGRRGAGASGAEWGGARCECEGARAFVGARSLPGITRVVPDALRLRAKRPPREQGAGRLKPGVRTASPRRAPAREPPANDCSAPPPPLGPPCPCSARPHLHRAPQGLEVCGDDAVQRLQAKQVDHARALEALHKVQVALRGLTQVVKLEGVGGGGGAGTAVGYRVPAGRTAKMAAEGRAIRPAGT